MKSNDSSEQIKVSAVIVTYNPVISNLTGLVASLEHQSFKTIIVDNGSNNRDEINLLDAVSSTVEFIFLTDNIGIAAAQNIGIRRSIELSSDFSLFFDQDSTISDDFVGKMLGDFLDIKKSKSIAALGPTLQDSRYNKLYPVLHVNKYGLRKKFVPDITAGEPVEVSCIIASGSLIENALLSREGMMDETLFIDYVDTEWCLRMHSRGYNVYITPNVVMKHEIGDAHIQLLGVVIPVHSPWRRYYRVRNGFYLFKMKHIPKLLAMREITFALIHQILLYVNSKNKEYIKIYFRAVYDVFKK